MERQVTSHLSHSNNVLKDIKQYHQTLAYSCAFKAFYQPFVPDHRLTTWCISKIVPEITVAAHAKAREDDPKAYATLLKGIQMLALASEKATETAKTVSYPVNIICVVELSLID